MNSTDQTISSKFLIPGGAIIVLFLSYFTYFRGYEDPNHFFWDENYHVSHAQKYLNGVFFMEPHPPLGKLMLAAGEVLLKENEKNDQFIGTDHAKSKPDNFSLRGYRLFSALFAWWTAPVLFLCFCFAFRRPLWALLLSLLYVFENSIIVHARGAMLEGPQLLFVACTFLFYFLLQQKNSRFFALWSIAFAVSFAAVVTTKVNGLILVLLVPAVAWQLWPDLKRFGLFLLLGIPSFAFTFILVWYAHFSIAKTINPALPDKGYYQASEQYKAILENSQTSSLFSLPVMLRDSMKFVSHYEKGVPQLNYCNQNENGSPSYYWPFGGKTINYRWEKKDGLTRYLYLVSNPAAWLIGLVGIIASIILFCGSYLLPVRERISNAKGFFIFLSLYCGYMIVMSQLSRVMYLYHYFLPLIFSYFLFGYVVDEIKQLGELKITESAKSWFLAACLVPVLLCFKFFSPLTYYEPLDDTQVQRRNWLGIWDLRCTSCKQTNGIASPTCDPKLKPNPDIVISGVKADSGTQDWGDPQQDRTVENKDLVVNGKKYEHGLGVHANSSFRFRLFKKYSRFKGQVGMPDYLIEKPGNPAKITFEIFADSRSIWRSGIMKPGETVKDFDVLVEGADFLDLKVGDAGDGIDNDHAIWLEPQLSN